MFNAVNASKTDAPIRFAVIGRNFVVDWMLEAAAIFPRLVFSGVCSRTHESGLEFGEKYGCDIVFDSIDELVESKDIDMVYIASPNAFHCEQAVKLLLSGKHVLCEKPIAPCLDDLHKMRDAALKSGKALMEAMVPLYMPAMKVIEDCIKKISPIRHAMLNFCQYSSRYDLFKNGKTENAFKPWLCNGALADIGVYCISVAERLFGLPEKIYGSACFLPKSIDGEGSMTAVYKDKIVNLNYSKISDSIVNSEICGENGNITIDSISRPHTISYKRRHEEIVTIDTVRYNRDNKSIPDMAYEICSFIAMIDDVQSGRTDMLNDELERCSRVIAMSDEIRYHANITYTE